MLNSYHRRVANKADKKKGKRWSKIHQQLAKVTQQDASSRKKTASASTKSPSYSIDKDIETTQAIDLPGEADNDQSRLYQTNDSNENNGTKKTKATRVKRGRRKKDADETSETSIKKNSNKTSRCDNKTSRYAPSPYDASPFGFINHIVQQCLDVVNPFKYFAGLLKWVFPMATTNTPDEKKLNHHSNYDANGASNGDALWWYTPMMLFLAIGVNVILWWFNDAQLARQTLAYYQDLMAQWNQFGFIQTVLHQQGSGYPATNLLTIAYAKLTLANSMHYDSPTWDRIVHFFQWHTNLNDALLTYQHGMFIVAIAMVQSIGRHHVGRIYSGIITLLFAWGPLAQQHLYPGDPMMTYTVISLATLLVISRSFRPAGYNETTTTYTPTSPHITTSRWLIIGSLLAVSLLVHPAALALLAGLFIRSIKKDVFISGLVVCLAALAISAPFNMANLSATLTQLGNDAEQIGQTVVTAVDHPERIPGIFQSQLNMAATQMNPFDNPQLPNARTQTPEQAILLTLLSILTLMGIAIGLNKMGGIVSLYTAGYVVLFIFGGFHHLLTPNEHALMPVYPLMFLYLYYGLRVIHQFFYKLHLPFAGWALPTLTILMMIPVIKPALQHGHTGAPPITASIIKPLPQLTQESTHSVKCLASNVGSGVGNTVGSVTGGLCLSMTKSFGKKKTSDTKEQSPTLNQSHPLSTGSTNTTSGVPLTVQPNSPLVPNQQPSSQPMPTTTSKVVDMLPDFQDAIPLPNQPKEFETVSTLALASLSTTKAATQNTIPVMNHWIEANLPNGTQIGVPNKANNKTTANLLETLPRPSQPISQFHSSALMLRQTLKTDYLLETPNTKGESYFTPMLTKYPEHFELVHETAQQNARGRYDDGSFARLWRVKHVQ